MCVCVYVYRSVCARVPMCVYVYRSVCARVPMCVFVCARVYFIHSPE